MSPYKAACLKVVLTLGLVLVPTSVFAAFPSSLQTFTTHGDFDVITTAFERIALIMSDGAYQGLFFTVAALVMLGLVAANMVQRIVLYMESALS